MPVLERDVGYHWMRGKVAGGARCGECRALLQILWSNNAQSWALACPGHPEHKGIMEYLPTEREREAQKVFRRNYMATGTALTTTDTALMLNRINMAKWPRDMGPEQRKLLARVAVEYGLDPVFGELILVHGTPFVGIQGRLRKAQETGELDGINSAPLTKEEKTARDWNEDDYAHKVQVWRKGCSKPFEEYGRVTRDEVAKAIRQCEKNDRDPDSLPIIKDPSSHALKRAKAAALKDGFYINLPSFEDIPFGDAALANVVEGTATVITDTSSSKSSATSSDKSSNEASKGSQDKSKRDPATIKSIGDLFNACLSEFKMDRQAVLRELNVKDGDPKQLSMKPADAYVYIVSLKQGPPPEPPQAEEVPF